MSSQGRKIGEEAIIEVDLDARGIADVEITDGAADAEFRDVIGAPVLTIHGEPEGSATIVVRGDAVETASWEVREEVEE